VWPFGIKDNSVYPCQESNPPDCPAHSPVTTPTTISQPTRATIMTNRKERRSKLCVLNAVRRFWPSEFYRRRCKPQPPAVSHTQACALFSLIHENNRCFCSLGVSMSRHQFRRSTPAPTDGRQDHTGHTKSLPSSFLTKGNKGKDRHHRV
jgi:hypothetical protein